MEEFDKQQQHQTFNQHILLTISLFQIFWLSDAFFYLMTIPKHIPPITYIFYSFFQPFLLFTLCAILKDVFLCCWMCLVRWPTFIVTPSTFWPQGGDTKYTFILIFQLEWVQCNTENAFVQTSTLSKRISIQRALRAQLDAVWNKFSTLAWNFKLLLCFYLIGSD